MIARLVARARSLWRGIRRRAAVEAEMREEFRLHLELRAADLVRAGLAPADALRQARREFGNPERYKEEGRASRGLRRVDALRFSWLDIKLGIRMLVRYPGLTLIGCLAISVAIGIGAGGFGFLHNFAHPTLPLPDGDRIVGIQNWDMAANAPDLRSLHDFELWRSELEVMDDIGAYNTLQRNLITADGRSEPVNGVAISASAFRVVRVTPLLGRPLVQADEQATAPPVVVIGYDIWQSRFGGDPGVIGQTVRLGRSIHTVVGVMPKGFAFPVNHDLWIPFRLHATAYARGQGPSIRIFGRLASGATLVFARTAARERELAVRSALGASRGRIIMQLFAEALVLASVAAVLGLAAAAGGLKWVMSLVAAFNGEAVPFWWTGALTPTTVLYVCGLTVLGAVVVGVLPALKVTGRGVQERLQRTAGNGSGLRFGWMWTGVIVTQVALSVFFLPDAISIARETMQGRGAVVAFPATDYLSARLEMDRLDGGAAPSESKGAALFRARFRSVYQELEQRLVDLPAVAGVTVATRLPGMDHPRRLIEVEGVAAPPDSVSRYRASTAQVDADFFDVLSAPILAGRAFNSGDLEPGRHIVIVNQSFVHQLLGDGNPIGRRVRFAADAGEQPGPWYEIVGVAKDLDMNPFSPNEGAGLYRPLVPGPSAPGGTYPLQIAVHVRGNPASFATQLRAMAAAVDPALRLYDVQPLDEIGKRVQLSLQLFASVMALVASIALLLSTAGIYSLMSFTVSRRTREIGIRAALGANPRRIVTAIFSRTAMQVGLGVAAGGLGALFLGDQVATEGPALLLVVAALMMAVGLLASAVPARRALRIQPTEALKADG